MSANTLPRPQEFRRGALPLLAALVGVALGASPLPFNSIGLVIGPMQKELAWSVEQITNSITIYGVIAALLAPLFGQMVDHFGARRVALVSLLAFIVCFSLLYFTPVQVYGWYALWVLVGLVGIGSTPVTWSRGVSQWFSRQRGLALGIMLLGTSITAIVLPKLGAWIVASFGWRTLFPALGLISLLIAVPLAYCFFREPTAAERPQELQDDTGRLLGLTMKETLQSWKFWVMVCSTILISLAYGGAHVHMVRMVMQHGFDVTQAATVASLVGLGIFLGRIVVGLLFDRFWAPAVAFPVLILPALSCYLLMGTGQEFAYLKLAGFLLGLAAGAESDVIAFMAARYFGMANYGKIFGLIYLFFGLCAAISPKIYARVQDQTGSYDDVLQIALYCYLLGGALLLLLGRYPKTLSKY
jgi:MFS transporter, OFA family, oxalate/formate antiporter